MLAINVKRRVCVRTARLALRFKTALNVENGLQTTTPQPIFAIRAPLEVNRRIASNAGRGRQTTMPTQDYAVTAVLGTKRTTV